MAKRAPLTTLTTSFARRFYERSQESSILRWPSEAYIKDIEGFANKILGIRFWSKQRAFALALQNNKRVAVKAGQKVSKTYTLAIAALWWYCCGGKVYITAPSFAQVKDPMWIAITELFNRSGTCLECRDKGITEHCVHSCPIDGDLHVLPNSGLIGRDGRQIIGLAVKKPDNVSGKSGAKILWILDEVIGIPANIFEAIQGTQMGGGSIAIASNPTEADPTNEFYMAFTSKAHLYKTLTISSYDSPNITGEGHFPGLAEPDKVEEKRIEWGEDSAKFKSRILGEFPTRGTDTMLMPDDVVKAQLRWDEPTDPAGVLAIGIDVAGQSTGNDSWSFAVRRGTKIVELSKIEGFDIQAGIDYLHEVLERHRVNNECPQVAFDGSNYFGGQFAIALGAYARKYPNTIAPRRMTPSAASPNDRFHRLRDYLIWTMVDHITKDLAIPSDPQLEEELLALKWDLRKSDSAGLDKVIDKAILRKVLKRSPDLSDAVSYACFGIERDGQPKTPNPIQKAQQAKVVQARLNPYRALQDANPYRRR